MIEQYGILFLIKNLKTIINKEILTLMLIYVLKILLLIYILGAIISFVGQLFDSNDGYFNLNVNWTKIFLWPKLFVNSIIDNL